MKHLVLMFEISGRGGIIQRYVFLFHNEMEIHFMLQDIPQIAVKI